MKILLVAGSLVAGFLLTGCETQVVEHDRYHHGYGYRGDSAVVYGRSDYNGGSSYNRDYHNHYDGGDYHTRNVERINVTENNINRTNVNRTVVNRTTVNQNVKKVPHAGGQVVVQSGQHPPKKGKHNDDDRKGHDEH